MKRIWKFSLQERISSLQYFGTVYSLFNPIQEPLSIFIPSAKGEKNSFFPLPLTQFFVWFVICLLLSLIVELWIQGLKESWISHSSSAGQILSLLPGPKQRASLARLCKSKADKCELSGANLLEIFPLVIGFIFQLLEKVESHYHPCLLPSRPMEREVGSIVDKEKGRMKLQVSYFSLSTGFTSRCPLAVMLPQKKHLISWPGPPCQW